ncbi:MULTISPECIES: TIGR02117 family protein [Flavobacterium]|uniref:TIGR02117 family protein n=1 Tax=Flavobacterium TaxID=237 RepID=UPI00034C2C6F|nr:MULTISPECIES: TIGR02117 family protein [Flavobacterium]MDL2142135.1 TIGR02117 family protein [Flavobacterium tructae]OXB21296.1 urease-associated protein [Flavobacterium tructae]URC10924.1 TIGR02117 family protein [Flavobacterium sp. B183]
MLKKSFKFLGWTLFGIFTFLALYVTAVLLISRITVNSTIDKIDEQNAIPIYILSNGVHTDIVVPIVSEVKDWRKEIQFDQTESNDTLAKFVAFGWGDKGFYLDTPEWSDLKASTALKAIFGVSSSAMHTTFFKQLREGEDCKRILVSKENYQKLVNYISESFNNPENPEWIEGHSYGKKDAFYEAKGSYSLFYTCNTWANCALKAANQKASLWTIYDKGIFYHYQ